VIPVNNSTDIRGSVKPATGKEIGSYPELTAEQVSCPDLASAGNRDLNWRCEPQRRHRSRDAAERLYCKTDNDGPVIEIEIVEIEHRRRAISEASLPQHPRLGWYQL
jgi:hypothetical protein